MTRNSTALKTMFALALLGSINLACAEVPRCEDNTTDVANACDTDAQLAQSELVEKPPARNVGYQQSLKNVQPRSTGWADMYVAPRKERVDRESVRSARLKMISLDGTSNYWEDRK
jgi:hypothetical protein